MQEIKKIDIISLARILGALYAVLGFIIGIIFARFSDRITLLYDGSLLRVEIPLCVKSVKNC